MSSCWQQRCCSTCRSRPRATPICPNRFRSAGQIRTKGGRGETRRDLRASDARSRRISRILPECAAESTDSVIRVFRKRSKPASSMSYRSKRQRGGGEVFSSPLEKDATSSYLCLEFADWSALCHSNHTQ